MFPTRLNLLPPENKKYLQKMVFTEFTKSTLETVLLLLCVSGMVLLAGQWVLQGYFNDLTENIVTAANQKAEVNQEIKEINKIIKQTRDLQTNYQLWSPTVYALAAAVPEGVILTEINIDTTNQTLIIGGLAKTRESLLTLEQNLESLPLIDSITIPLSQLTEKENVVFSFSTKIN